MPRSQQLPTDGGDMPFVLATPEGDASVPFLIIVPSIFGVGDDVLEQVRELAEHAGVIAMDPFWRVEPGAVPYDDAPRAFARMNELDREASYRDFVALVEWARSHERCNGKVAVLGICFGGPFCLLAAADGLVDGVVTWHGSRMHDFVDRAAEMRCPMHHHVGGADTIVPPETVEQIREAFQERADVELVVHPGAGHGFSHRGSPAYQQAAENAGMAAVRALLRQLG